jgi:hypothetical protein
MIKIALDGSEYESEDFASYREDNQDDAKTQEEVESCRDWGCPYDTESGVPFQLQQDRLEFG